MPPWPLPALALTLLAAGAAGAAAPLPDASALVQRSALAVPALEPPPLAERAAAPPAEGAAAAEPLPAQDGGLWGSQIHSAVDILKFLDEMKELQDALQHNASQNESMPHAVVKSRANDTADEPGDIDFDLLVDFHFVLGDVLRLDCTWGLMLKKDGCHLDVVLKPNLGVSWALKGPVMTWKGFKIDWMPPLMLVGTRGITVRGNNDEFTVQGMCQSFPVMSVSIRACLTWTFRNLAGCNFTSWDVSVRGTFMAHENLPFPLQGLVPALPTPDLSLGVIDV